MLKLPAIQQRPDTADALKDAVIRIAQATVPVSELLSE